MYRSLTLKDVIQKTKPQQRKKYTLNFKIHSINYNYQSASQIVKKQAVSTPPKVSASGNPKKKKQMNKKCFIPAYDHVEDSVKKKVKKKRKMFL
jgi:hypothetical protein